MNHNLNRKQVLSQHLMYSFLLVFSSLFPPPPHYPLSSIILRSSFRPVTPPHSSLPPAPSKKRDASVDPVVGAAVQFASLFAENLLSHPCVVLRRQCQVGAESGNVGAKT